MTTSYALLEGVISALQNEFGPGLGASGNIHLATFGDSRLLDFLPIPVVSLPQQYEQIAEAAWSITEQAIENNDTPQNRIIARTLKRRL